jgi:cohesin complex subunit SA-1/2
VKQAATGEPPVGRGPNRKVQSAKEAKQISDDKAKLTEHFMPVLPTLLGKFLADPEKIGNLMLIPQYFDLELYTTHRQEKSLESLLHQMITIVDKHTDSEVLETCAKTLEVLCDEEYAISSKSMYSRGVLLDNVVTKFKEALDEFNSLIAGDEEPDEDEVFALVSSLKKVSIFYSCHNLGHLGVWDLLYQQIKDAKDGQSNLPVDAVKHCLSSCQFALMWDLVLVEEMIEQSAQPARIQSAAETLKNRVKSFIDSALVLIQNAPHQDYKEEAFLSISDLLIIFGDQLARNQPTLSTVVYSPDRSVQSLLNDFIQKYVFIEEDDSEDQDEHSKIEELHKRRNYLASFCKLIVYSILPTRAAAEVFKHYVRFYNDYGDIIKATIGKAREINKVNCARTMALALIMIFKELQMEGIHNNRHSEEFTALKELSKRFALSFGLDAVKNREAITACHREGILFAVNPGDQGPNSDPTQAPANISFLDVLSEFTNKLLKQDKRVV